MAPSHYLLHTTLIYLTLTPLASSLIAQGLGQSTSLTQSPLPTTTATTRSTPTASLAPHEADPCGPSIPVPNIGNTCTSPLARVSNASIYGVECLSLTSPQQLNAELCSALIDAICQSLSNTAAPLTDEWVWATNSGCALGFWYPSTYPGPNGKPIVPANVPSYERCSKGIFGSMVGACMAEGGGMYSAAVNLGIVPSETGNGLPASEYGRSYPSYYVTGSVTGVTLNVPSQ